MERGDILKVLGIIKCAYPKFYQGIKVEEAKDTADLWCEMFKENDSKDVAKAVKELICTLEFPPTIADVKNKIKRYESDRRFVEYAKQQEELEKQERLMLEAKLERYVEEGKPKVDASKYIAEMKKKLFGGGGNDV